ncbi:IS1096 element passenger TnpR family protein [Bradyrhizobium yuanmingense]|uniref:IS1096 element passenger TnpR family protein n=1 Tax=Bradyrhizobium yuanmingense TaxID=108015 RepID=UPI0034DF04F3
MLVVAATLRLDRLHLALQEAFGWTNSHLFEFFAGEVRWGVLIPTTITAASPWMPPKRGFAMSSARPALRRFIISTTSATAGTM